jgi:hypothetical protein
MSRFERDSHAGDAVMIAPVSNELPCKQGILQGISQKSAIVRRPLRGKRLSCSDFFKIPYWIYQGNNCREQGFGAFIRENCLRFRRPLVRKWTLVASSVWRLMGSIASVLRCPCYVRLASNFGRLDISVKSTLWAKPGSRHDATSGFKLVERSVLLV